MQHKLNQDPPLKVPEIWKSTTSQAGTFGGGDIYPELHLDPCSCGGNTKYHPKVPNSWEKVPAVEMRQNTPTIYPELYKGSPV